jgi:hypothetical protein
MEVDMNDVLTVSAGGLGMLIAVVHGYLGETQVVRPISGAPASAKRVLQAIMFFSALYWFVAGAILAASPFYLTGNDRRVAAMVACMIYLTAAAGNFWALRGRHFGWILLSAASALAWLGA